MPPATADLMRRAGVTSVAPLDSVSALEASIPRFIASLRTATRIADAGFAATCSRKARTRQLAEILDTSA
jgi:hypothetical protein